ncbi:MAG: hypothetical protein R2705_14415 [Ilumatobacteraceae bacterium]
MARPKRANGALVIEAPARTPMSGTGSAAYPEATCHPPAASFCRTTAPSGIGMDNVPTCTEKPPAIRTRASPNQVVVAVASARMPSASHG